MGFKIIKIVFVYLALNSMRMLKNRGLRFRRICSIVPSTELTLPIDQNEVALSLGFSVVNYSWKGRGVRATRY